MDLSILFLLVGVIACHDKQHIHKNTQSHLSKCKRIDLVISAAGFTQVVFFLNQRNSV